MIWDDIPNGIPQPELQTTPIPPIFANYHNERMIKSLALYSKYLMKIASLGRLHYVTADLRRYSHGQSVFHEIPSCTGEQREQALEKVIRWLIHSQGHSQDGGMGSFHLANGWGGSYPETTGYIIPTLLEFSERYHDSDARHSAQKASDFLLEIQKPSGGWQGGRIGEDRPEIVFNTGQVLRGMIAAYEAFSDLKYLDAAVKGAHWLCKVQHTDGYWKEHALMNEARVYDSFVDAPLLKLFELTGETKFRDAALRNLNWITEQKMQRNGWFEDCDNTVKRNDRPILHTIAYTLDGLIESDEVLKEGIFMESATNGADVLKDKLVEEHRLYGRYDRNWNGSEFMLCTGLAQMAIVWQRLYKLIGDSSYLYATDRALNTLVFIQNRNMEEAADTLGAIPGSFPIWGRYEPFAFPNWASKFFADALLMRLQMDE